MTKDSNGSECPRGRNGVGDGARRGRGRGWGEKISDDESMVEQTQMPQGSKASSSRNVQLVPSGPMIRARAKKFRESFQALVCDVQTEVGNPRGIRDLEHDETALHMLIQVINASEVEEV